uniref:(northern house mosquito) hypothetical protein n=1 Tax=Culex pipiens TaxID=7175 RepID=A0A8D8JJX3_CULPI
MFDSVSFFFVLFSSVGSQFLVHWRVVVLFFFVVESENNSVLKGFCFDSFLFLFSSTEHTRRARENWLSFDMCLCIIFVFAFIANVVVAKKGGRNSETRLETVRD